MEYGKENVLVIKANNKEGFRISTFKPGRPYSTLITKMSIETLERKEEFTTQLIIKKYE